MLPLQILQYTSSENDEIEASAKEIVPKWEEIAGLEEAKATLEETILWPILYKDFYKKNGFDQTGGVLLYGPSGTGKTLLARSFANLVKDHAKVLTVAGPSLLGKYVGSSERAVRDLFSKARAQNPTLLILEEVEAMAPKRGSDNTGTTDRVVNQLLTELDGAEGRSGVFVLALSSRPDLIDPALLRPGRIDTRLAIKLPTSIETRREIIMSVAPEEVSLDLALVERLATDSEGMSAADLKAILLDAQIEANRFDSSNRAPITAELALYSLVNYKSTFRLKKEKDERKSQKVTFA